MVMAWYSSTKYKQPNLMGYISKINTQWICSVGHAHCTTPCNLKSFTIFFLNSYCSCLKTEEKKKIEHGQLHSECPKKGEEKKSIKKRKSTKICFKKIINIYLLKSFFRSRKRKKVEFLPGHSHYNFMSKNKDLHESTFPKYYTNLLFPSFTWIYCFGTTILRNIPGLKN